MSVDGNTLTVPAPATLEGTTLSGDGWRVTLAPGWVVRRGPRAGDFQVVREPPILWSSQKGWPNQVRSLP